jgi:hypothetical protein
METDVVVQRCIRVPAIEARHCERQQFMCRPYVSVINNAQMFRGMVAREMAKVGVRAGQYLDLEHLPEAVSVDTSKYLAEVSITLP